MITFSGHASFHDHVFSMYQQLKDKYQVWTLTNSRTDYPGIHEKYNLYTSAPSNPGISKETLNIKEIRKIISDISKIDPDIVYFESFHTWNYPIIFYCKRHNIVVAHAIHDVTIHKGDSHRQIKKMLNYSYASLSDRLITRSEASYEEAKALYPKFVKKIRTVDLWYSFPNYKKTRGEYVLFFGRMNPYKGIAELYSLIQCTPKLSYVVAGKSDDTVKDILDNIRKLPNVRVVDSIVPYEDMQMYFANARCVVLPYKSATQSGVILDSYRYSKPVVAFNVGALGEEIEDGITGYVVPSGDVSGMAEKVKQIVEMNDSDYDDFCRNAYEYGFGRYSAESQMNNFISAIGLEEDKAK